MTESGTPAFIIPCVKVFRRIYDRALTDRTIMAEVTVTYTSRGEPVTRVFDIPLGDFFLSDHHAQPHNRAFRLIETLLDISDAPIDDGTLPTGSITLSRTAAAA
jgi:hypothetical protein